MSNKQIIRIDFSSKNYDKRPIFNLLIGNLRANVLLDTGAMVSVWDTDIITFMRYFPNAQKLQVVSNIGGFGDGRIEAFLYNVGDLELHGVDGNKVVIKDFCIAVTDKPQRFSFPMILSVGVFTKSLLAFSYEKNYQIILKCDKEIRFKLHFKDNEYDKPNPENGCYTHNMDDVFAQDSDLSDIFLPKRYIFNDKNYHYTCISRWKSIDGYFVKYEIMNKDTGEKEVISAKDLKDRLKNDISFLIDNLVLTSDDKLHYQAR